MTAVKAYKIDILTFSLLQIKLQIKHTSQEWVETLKIISSSELRAAATVDALLFVLTKHVAWGKRGGVVVYIVSKPEEIFDHSCFCEYTSSFFHSKHFTKICITKSKINYREHGPPLLWEYIRLEVKNMKVNSEIEFKIRKQVYIPPPTHTHTDTYMYAQVDQDFHDSRI